MAHILVVVDMQNDFITGALGTPEAQSIVSRVKARIEDFTGDIYFTRDTHHGDYLDTQEGRNLPVSHCIEETDGWEICDALQPYAADAPIIDKPTFGSIELAEALQEINLEDPVKSVTLIGLCTDICVISNAMLLKAALPEIDIIIDAACCAGVTPEGHATALHAMRACQIIIENV